MPSCQELTELVTDYLEGEMSFSERVRFKLHVSMCAPCKRYLEQVELTVDTLGSVPTPVIPPEVKDDLMQAFRDWKS
jgi:predicted anti-sigma-YlaC factor YlaD